MKKKSEFNKPSIEEEEKKLLKQWKREKAIQTAKEIGVSILCGALNGICMYGRAIPLVYFNVTPPVVYPENIYPIKRK